MSNYIDFLCTLGVERIINHITLELKKKNNCHLSIFFVVIYRIYAQVYFIKLFVAIDYNIKKQIIIVGLVLLLCTKIKI